MGNDKMGIISLFIALNVYQSFLLETSSSSLLVLHKTPPIAVNESHPVPGTLELTSPV
jgi:hypothetical protein